jgi:hypothetical protein
MAKKKIVDRQAEAARWDKIVDRAFAIDRDSPVGQMAEPEAEPAKKGARKGAKPPRGESGP